ncbi:nuclear transport factor 2 family protein [Euzebyella marina]|uniref:nuclear transport factor 2 family protein n=1 Tax=Euzebyella marina TaxID=1761453 RepID=UPI001969E68C|nr:nuclear transport factor 2 family protein [Euzebyella marina]
MKNFVVVFFIVISSTSLFSQGADIQTEIKELSKQKWQWMAEKDVDKLANLFHEKAKFVHMSGSWKKDRELEIIQTGSIWYKQGCQKRPKEGKIGYYSKSRRG